MAFAIDCKLLLLVIVANGTPVLAKDLLGRRYSFPLDGERNFIDGHRVLGSTKTLRGILLSLGATTIVALATGLGWAMGLSISAAAMLGDLASSFLKRRLGFAPSSMAIGLDQIPESLFPLLVCARIFALTAADIAAVVAAFLASELLLSRILYRFGLRDRPY
jgi:CDP-2,3-bis-(O-geranylgeranyl)-sn-glycerol synthase